MLKVAWSPIYAHPLPKGHRFPMEKYTLIPEQLLYEGTLAQSNFFTPTPIAEEAILRAHTQDYWHNLNQGKLTKKEMRKTGFPWSPELVHRELVISQGTLEAAHHALAFGIGMNISGGTHHAFSNRGEGFCLLNDFAMAGLELLAKQLVEKILIIDLDVHQGNGTAEIFQHNAAVFTFSMHGAGNYPLKKENSDLDVPLTKGMEDKAYLSLLHSTLPQLLEEVKPDFVFYLSGVDILATDKLGLLSLTREGCKERDRIVFELLKAKEIPVCVAMGGGYSVEIRDIVEAHCNTFRLAQEIWF